MKTPKSIIDENGKLIRNQSLGLIDDIKKIVISDGENDRRKVEMLKKLLGLHEENSDKEEEDNELRDLLS